MDLNELAMSMAHEIDPTVGNSRVPEVEETLDLDPEVELEDTDQDTDQVADQEEEVENAEEKAKREAEEEQDEESEEESEDGEEETESEDEESETETPSEEADLHTVTVDGEEQKVSLQELKDNYAGKQAWDKKFTEVSYLKAEQDKRAETFNNNVKQFEELCNEGKAQEALDFLLETAGQDRNRFVEAYVSQLAPTIAEYLELSPTEREQRALKQQVEYYKGQQERLRETETQRVRRTELEGQVNKVLDEHKIDTDRFEELHKELIEAGIENITPDIVGQYHVMVVQQDTAIEVLKDINPDLVKDKSAMDYLLSLQQNNPGMKKEDLKKRAEKAFVDALAERVKKDSKAAKPKKGKKGSSKAKKELAKEILTFDDLENINPFDLLN